MNNHQVTKRLILDAVPVAEQLQLLFGTYLLPPEQGYYLPTSVGPVLKTRRYYYQKGGVSTERIATGATDYPVTSIETLRQADIYDIDGRVVVPKELIKHLRTEPYVPTRALQVIYSAVDQVLRHHAAWTSKPVGSASAFLSDHLLEEYRQGLPESEDDLEIMKALAAGKFYQPGQVDAWRVTEIATRTKDALELRARNSEIHDQIVSHLADVRNDVRDFIGQDKWVMHFHYASARDIVVEKTVDFRIFDWERRMASGEWK